MKNPFAGLLFVLILALAVRLHGMVFDSLWLDEGYQSMVDAYGRPLPDLVSIPEHAFIFHFKQPVPVNAMLANFRNVDPLCPPLYPVLLNRWITTFGGSDVALRSLSVILSMLSVGSIYALSYKFFGPRAAFAALLDAISPFDIYYAREVRMYGLLVLTATLSCGALMMLLFNRSGSPATSLYDSASFGRGGPCPPGWRCDTPTGARDLCILAVYVISTWAMINSHYTALFVFVFQLIVGCAVILFRRSRLDLFQLVAGWLTIGLLWLPWFSMFQQAAALRTASFYVARKPTLWWPIVALLVRIPANWVVFLTGKQVVSYAVPVFVTGILILVAAAASTIACRTNLPISAQCFFRLDSDSCGIIGRKALWKARLGRNALLFVWMWALVPALLLWSVDVVENHRVVEISRYVIATAPAVFLLSGVGMAALNLRNKWVWLLIGCQLLFAETNNWCHATMVHEREPWRQMAQKLEQTVPADQLVLVSQYYDVACLDRYLTMPYKQVGVSPVMGEPHLQSLLRNVKRFALITAQEGESLTQIIPATYHEEPATRIDLEHGLHLRQYAR